jgi:hypothetical protein
VKEMVVAGFKQIGRTGVAGDVASQLAIGFIPNFPLAPMSNGSH